MFTSYLLAQFHIYYDALIVIILFIQHLRNTSRYCFYSLRVHIIGVCNRNRNVNVNVNVNALIFNTLCYTKNADNTIFVQRFSGYAGPYDSKPLLPGILSLLRVVSSLTILLPSARSHRLAS